LFGGLIVRMSRTDDRLRLPCEDAEEAIQRSSEMKFMLMMNAPSGNGDWGISKWAPEDSVQESRSR
jgi:hypothetical protein